MAYAFGTPAKPTFGNLRESVYQSEYIGRKKGKLLYCNNINVCNRLRNSDSYDKINIFNKGLYTYRLNKCPILPCSKDNLVVGQYTKLDLKDVCVVVEGKPAIIVEGKPCSYTFEDTSCENKDDFTINLNNVFYQSSIIDPKGQLFGDTQCGQNNFVKYMVYNPSCSNRLIFS